MYSYEKRKDFNSGICNGCFLKYLFLFKNILKKNFKKIIFILIHQNDLKILTKII
jgi:hypothetical protein